MAEIRWTDEAATWLHDIYEYIAKDNQKSASNVINSIYQKVQILKEFPEIGYQYKAMPEGDVRILLYGHYRITYLIRKYANIDILGIFHGSLDISRYI